jgi:hypothetical protein
MDHEDGEDSKLLIRGTTFGEGATASAQANILIASGRIAESCTNERTADSQKPDL